MDYQGAHVIRPPSEADSILLQVVVGCPHNRCTFCATYKEERCRLKNHRLIEADLEFARTHCLRQRKLFLMDGDVLALPQRQLVGLFTRIRERLPWVRRIRLYGSARSLLRKSVTELAELKSLGLDRVYMGLESGDDQTLEAIHKGVDSSAMIEAGIKARQAGLFLSVTVLLGIAGEERSLVHARATGRVLTAMAPNQVGVLTLMVLPGTPLYEQQRSGRFRLPGPAGLLAELGVMVEHIDLKRVQFQANHASNYLPVNARLSRDRDKVLAAIDMAIRGRAPLTPEHLRAL